MKHIKNFPLFESYSLSDNQKKFLDSAYRDSAYRGPFSDSKWKQNPETGEITVLGTLNPSDVYHKLTSDKRKVRDIFQTLSFAVIEGAFIAKRMYLDNMNGFPHFVEGEMEVQGNEFKTAEGAPKMIYGNLYLSNNHLITLEGLEETSVRGTLYLEDNFVRSPFLKEDLEKARRIGTWAPIYLDILSGETRFTSVPNPNEKEEVREFIMGKKLTKEKLEEAIRVAPSEMKVALSRKKDMSQELQDLLPMLDTPSDFWEDSDLMGDLSDVGL